MAPQLEGIGLPKPVPLSGLTVVLEMFLVFLWRLQSAMIIRHPQKGLSVRSCLLLNHVLQLLYLSSAMLITNQCLFTYSCWISRSLLEMVLNSGPKPFCTLRWCCLLTSVVGYILLLSFLVTPLSKLGCLMTNYRPGPRYFLPLLIQKRSLQSLGFQLSLTQHFPVPDFSGILN